MQLDLSNNGRLSLQDSALIDRIALQVQEEFNIATQSLVSINNLSDLELLLSVVSRNPSQTSVLLSLCKIRLLNEKLSLSELSMGMSSDYIIATENYSTYLRIGSGIFGERI